MKKSSPVSILLMPYSVTWIKPVSLCIDRKIYKIKLKSAYSKPLRLKSIKVDMNIHCSMNRIWKSVPKTIMNSAYTLEKIMLQFIINFNPSKNSFENLISNETYSFKSPVLIFYDQANASRKPHSLIVYFETSIIHSIT